MSGGACYLWYANNEHKHPFLISRADMTIKIVNDPPVSVWSRGAELTSELSELGTISKEYSIVRDIELTSSRVNETGGKAGTRRMRSV